MPTLLESLTNQIDDRTIRQISGQLGIEPSKTEQAVAAALPMLLGALERNAATPERAQMLSDTLTREHDGSVLERQEEVLAEPATMEYGLQMINDLLGRKRQNVQTGVSQISGLDANMTSQLLALLAPLVLGVLGKRQQDQNLDAEGLASLLDQERSTTDASLGSLTMLLDSDGDGDVTDDMLAQGSNLLGNLFGRRR